jgi:hypothetical protein
MDTKPLISLSSSNYQDKYEKPFSFTCQFSNSENCSEYNFTEEFSSYLDSFVEYYNNNSILEFEDPLCKFLTVETSQPALPTLQGYIYHATSSILYL